MQEKINILHEIVQDTCNAEFRLTCDSIEWKIYIVHSQTTFRGTFEEVVETAIEEFMSYRQPSTQPTHFKNYKPYTY